MAVTLISAQQVDMNVWRLEWTSDLPSPTYYLYANGVLSGVTTATVHYATVPPDSALFFEVFDNALDMPAEQWADTVVLTWAHVAGASYYRVEQFVEGAWLEIGQAYPSPQGGCRYQSAPLADCAQHKFRVIAVAANGRESAPREWSVFMVRRPPAPALSYEYDNATTTVTINA